VKCWPLVSCIRQLCFTLFSPTPFSPDTQCIRSTPFFCGTCPHPLSGFLSPQAFSFLQWIHFVPPPLHVNLGPLSHLFPFFQSPSFSTPRCARLIVRPVSENSSADPSSSCCWFFLWFFQVIPFFFFQDPESSRNFLQAFGAFKFRSFQRRYHQSSDL